MADEEKPDDVEVSSFQPAEDIRNGRELFTQTAGRFDMWYADSYGIHPSYNLHRYQNMSMAESLQVAMELIAIVEFCSRLDATFPDLHSHA